jgi:hypothetical protein
MLVQAAEIASVVFQNKGHYRLAAPILCARTAKDKGVKAKTPTLSTTKKEN